MSELSDLAYNFAESVAPATIHSLHHAHVECDRCGQRFMRYGFMGRECPACGYRESSACEAEGDREEMCPRHWLLEGVRNGSCPDCLGAEVPDGRAAVIVTDDCGVTFANPGDEPVAAPALLGPLSVVARAEDVSPGDVLATFSPGESRDVTVEIELPERQVSLLEVGE